MLGVVLSVCLLCSLPVAQGANRLGSEIVPGDRSEDLLNCMCFDETTGKDCPESSVGSQPCEDWAKSLATDVWPAVLLLVLFWVVVIWRCARCCCKCCGSSVPSGGCCGGYSALEAQNQAYDANTSPFRGYGSCQRYTFRILLASAAGIAIALVAPGLALNEQITDGVKGVGKEIDTFTQDLSHALAFIDRDVVTLPDLTPSARDTLTSQSSAVYSAIDTVNDYKDDIYKYNHDDKIKSREGATVIFGAVVLFMFLLIGLVGVFSCSRIFPAIIFGLMCIVVLVIAAVTIAHHFAAMATSDVCTNYDMVAIELNQKIGHEVGCNPGSTDKLAKVNTLFAESSMKFQDRMCTDYLSQQYGGVGFCEIFNCNLAELCQPNTTTLAQFFDTLLTSTVRQNATGLAGAVTGQVLLTCTAPCTVSSCAGQCTGSLQDVSQSMAGNWSTYGPIIREFEAEVIPISTCLTVRQLINNVRHPFCTDISDPLVDVFALCLTCLLLALLSAVLLTLGTKRFIPEARAGQIMCVSQGPPGKGV